MFHSAYKLIASSRLVILLSFMAFTSLGMVSVVASDMEKERRWAEQVESDLFDGEALYLKHGHDPFLALITKADQPKQTAVLILHGIGVHPDWPEVINPLRVGLAEQGWDTLSIQLPVLENGAPEAEYRALLPEAASRITAGLSYLQEQGAVKLVIAAHSIGSRMANYYLANVDVNKLQKVNGYVAVGMNRDNEQWLSAINLPMLDLYGEHDLSGVLDSASTRAQAAKANSHYQQIEVDGADHFFVGYEERLLELITTWLSEQGL